MPHLSQQTFILMKRSSRRLHEGEYIRLSHISLAGFFNVLDQDQYIHLHHTSWKCFKTFSRRPQEVFKTSRRLKDVFKTSYKKVFKTSSRPLAKVSCQGTLKTSSKGLQNLLQRCLQDIFKAFPRRYQVELYLLTRPHNVLQTYSTRFWDVLRRRLSTAKFE